MSDALTAVTVVSALSCGLLAGVFFAFSTFVMAGLARLDAREGILAMQAINVAAPRSLLVPAMGLAALASASAGAIALAEGRGPLLAVAAGIYLAGVIVVTGAANVPRNEALAALGSDSLDGPGAGEEWRRYLGEWTRWNHLRTVTPLGAAILQTAALASA